LRQTGAGVWLLPYGQADMAGALADTAMLAAAPDTLTAILRAILIDPAIILVVDTPPGPSAALRAVLPLADLLVTVLLSDATSIALIPTVEQGHAYGADHASSARDRHGFVLNQVNPLSRLSRATTEATGRQLGHRLLGSIARDESVAEAIANQQSVIGYSPASRAARDLAQLTAVIATRLDEARHPAPPMPRPDRFGHLVRHP
jgi:MinD-like ATPase involved in chromosome partitioning or flagellar assembly